MSDPITCKATVGSDATVTRAEDEIHHDSTGAPSGVSAGQNRTANRAAARLDELLFLSMLVDTRRRWDSVAGSCTEHPATRLRRTVLIPSCQWPARYESPFSMVVV
jgi:hypothetical protein